MEEILALVSEEEDGIEGDAVSRVKLLLHRLHDAERVIQDVLDGSGPGPLPTWEKYKESALCYSLKWEYLKLPKDPLAE